MCFSYGRVGHKVDGCPYITRASEKESGKQPGEDTMGQKDSHTPSDETYGPWVLISRKKQTIRRTRKESTQLSPFGPNNTAKEWPIAQATNPSAPRPASSGFGEKDAKIIFNGFSHGSAFVTYRTISLAHKHQT